MKLFQIPNEEDDDIFITAKDMFEAVKKWRNWCVSGSDSNVSTLETAQEYPKAIMEIEGVIISTSDGIVERSMISMESKMILDETAANMAAILSGRQKTGAGVTDISLPPDSIVYLTMLVGRLQRILKGNSIPCRQMPQPENKDGK